MTGRDKDAQPNPAGFTRRLMIAGSAGIATTMAVTAVAPAAPHFPYLGVPYSGYDVPSS